MKRIIIIGGLSAGPSAAAKARRYNENAEILLFEKTANISYATCGIPYALSGKIKDREDLMVVEANLLRERFNIDVRLNEEVLEVLPGQHKIRTGKGVYEYDKLVYAAGAGTFIPSIKNMELAGNWSACRTLEDFERIMKNGVVSDVKHITIMGAGLIGVEVAENLKKIGKDVTLIEGNAQVLPMWEKKFSRFAQFTLEENGIQVITNTFVKEFEVESGLIRSIKINEEQSIQTDYVIMSVGIRPNTSLLTSRGAEHIDNGAVKVNEKMETSLPDIYAAGDCASIKNVQTGEYDYLPLGTHSNKGGRTAGVNAAGGNETFVGGYKTAIVKLFEKTMARTGMNPRFMKEKGIAFETNLIIASSTPGYYPNPKDLLIEIYYSPEEGTILGAELFGEKGVDKRVDVLSTAIYAKLKVTDLPNLDLAYAPPFSPAKDPVVVSGYVSSNAHKSDYKEISVEKLQEIIENEDASAYTILDVRTTGEIKQSGKIEGAVEINVNHLRDHLDQIDKEKPTYIYCAKGMRGYLAFLILQQNGFTQLANLSGGYTVWNMLNEKIDRSVFPDKMEAIELS